MIYKFRRDWKVILVSVLSIVAIPIVLCVDWYVEGNVEVLYVLPFWVLLMAGVILRTPRYYYIEKDLIIVKFFLGSKTLDGIRDVRPIGSVDLKRCSRTFGNGGVMGYTGYFRSSELGNFQMLAVNKNELALVTLNNGKQYVINYPHELLESNKESSDNL